MRKLRLIAVSSAAALAAVLIPGATTALAGTADLPGACQYYTDFDFVGGQLSIYDSKSCNGVTQPAYAVIEKVSGTGTVIPVAYGLGIVRYTCQGSAVNTFRFDGDLSKQVILTPGALPCG
ncbi:hypothetical protein GA0115240_17096 [Streptomyces sp. DvalAA-14]|uniref:hypothetical protein n=1 Tax=unclassified Streptomyces TaxID=2593676 RepID=UPI00081B0E02|nr:MULTISPECIES: hypothetical protein [unclassified Streptomyces]MYS24880.1 hypothetical protein [Streptomyces sp. SID4948]SCE50236.1 hypothetical protein GA0115240_17096 [Streptomyces sp. DvalAA-14]